MVNRHAVGGPRCSCAVDVPYRIQHLERHKSVMMDFFEQADGFLIEQTPMRRNIMLLAVRRMFMPSL